MMKKYIDTKIITTRHAIGIILFDKTKRVIMKLEGKEWVKSEPEDEREIAEEALKKYALKGKTFNSIVGFIDVEQKNNSMVFKTKIH